MPFRVPDAGVEVSAVALQAVVALGDLLPGLVPPALEESGHVVSGAEQQDGRRDQY